jgi:DNA-binding transcriptional ArsR family regulator
MPTTLASAPDLALAALADPTRRQLLERLRGGPSTVGGLAGGLPISRPAVSRHLRILHRAGLVSITPAGRRSVCRLDGAGVEPLRRYLDGLWDDVLAAFADAADAEAGAPSGRPARRVPGGAGR